MAPPFRRAPARSTCHPASFTIGLLGSAKHAVTRVARRLLRDNRAFVRRYFEHVYRSEDPYAIAHHPLEQEKRDGTIAAIRGRRFSRVLEIGGGEGLLAARLADQAVSLLMVDLSRRALDRAEHRLAGRDNVEVRLLDVVADPLPGTFDLIVCSEVLIYVPEPRLEEVRAKVVAALDRGGHLLLVHSRSIHDDEQGLEYKDIGARTVHGAFIDGGGLEVVADQLFDSYRITLLRRPGSNAGGGGDENG